MMIYLVTMTHKQSGKVAWKIGHCKGKLAERFGTSEYDDFEIKLVSKIFLSATDWKIAKITTEVLEEAIRVVIPPKTPDFMIENYFGVEPGSLKIGGVTEMFFPQSKEREDQVINIFNRFRSAESKFNKIMGKY